MNPAIRRRRKPNPRFSRDEIVNDIPPGDDSQPVVLARRHPRQLHQLNTDPPPDGTPPGDEETGSTFQQPVRILKAGECIDPQSTPPTDARKTKKPLEEENCPQPSTQRSAPEAPLSPLLQMHKPVKLVDEFLQWCGEPALEYLSDDGNYLVIGVLGLQGAGKSQVLSALADPSSMRKSPVFRLQSRDNVCMGRHCTSGIDMYVSEHRHILLDAQAICCSSIMDNMIQNHKKHQTEFSSTLTAVEIQSLQIAGFLMTVCHVIILVQEWHLDPDVIEFLLMAEMLRPSTPFSTSDALSDHCEEYYPQLVLLHNHCREHHFYSTYVQQIQSAYQLLLAKSNLHCTGSKYALGGGLVMPHLHPQSLNCNPPMNVFFLPERPITSRASTPQPEMLRCKDLEASQHDSPQSAAARKTEKRRQTTSSTRSPDVEVDLSRVWRNWDDAYCQSVVSQLSQWVEMQVPSILPQPEPLYSLSGDMSQFQDVNSVLGTDSGLDSPFLTQSTFNTSAAPFVPRKSYWTNSSIVQSVDSSVEEKIRLLDPGSPFSCHPSTNRLYEYLWKMVATLPRASITHAAQTEKTWFHYSARSWETIRKSTAYTDYCRLMSVKEL